MLTLDPPCHPTQAGTRICLLGAPVAHLPAARWTFWETFEGRNTHQKHSCCPIKRPVGWESTIWQTLFTYEGNRRLIPAQTPIAQQPAKPARLVMWGPNCLAKVTPKALAFQGITEPGVLQMQERGRRLNQELVPEWRQLGVGSLIRKHSFTGSGGLHLPLDTRPIPGGLSATARSSCQAPEINSPPSKFVRAPFGVLAC